ncbi:MAG: WG repeat-containing protein [Clostridia bacterium]|nr:WG repeat-containing protein [Clostridia bacterium]
MKRIFIFALVFAMLLMPNANALIAVNGSFSALVSENGENVCLPGVFSAVLKVTDNLYSVRSAETNRFSLMTETGEMLTESKYTLFRKIGENAILFEKDGKYGVMDEKANVKIENEYTWIVSNGAGGYLALRTDVWDSAPDGVYLIDETGYVSPTGVKVSSFLMDFSEGLSPALSTENGKYGYLNPEGQWEIRPQYAYADGFLNGCAVATLDSGSGVIDKNGSWQIMPKYDFVDIGNEDSRAIACVNYGSSVNVFSRENFERIYSFDDDLMGAYLSVSGNSVIAYFDHRVAEFDLSGNEIASVLSSGYLFPVTGGYTIGYDDGNAFLLDAFGKRVLDGFRELTELTTDGENVYFTFVKGDVDVDDYRIGVVDQTGREVLSGDYTLIQEAEKGYLLAENEGGMYLFALSGEMIWKYEY